MALNEAKSGDSVDKHNNVVNEFARILKAIEIERKNAGISKENYERIYKENEVFIKLPRINAKKIDIFEENDKVFIGNLTENPVFKLFCEENAKENEENCEENVKWSDLLEKINGKNKEKGFLMNLTQNIKEKANFRLFDCKTLEEKNQIYNRKDRFSYVGETIYIGIEFENPLKIGLDLKNIEVLYEFEPISGNIEKNSEKNEEINDKNEEIYEKNEKNNEIIGKNTNFPDKISDFVEISSENLQISPLSSQNECFLQIKAKIPGKLKVIGLKWTIFKMTSRFLFDFKGKKLKDGLNHDKNLKNSFEILPNSSILHVFVENWLENLYFGEISQVKLTLKNAGNEKISKIFIANSHPNFLGFSCKKLDFELKSGEIKVVSFVIRGSFVKKTEIKILIKYIVDENIHKNIRILLPIKVFFKGL